LIGFSPFLPSLGARRMDIMAVYEYNWCVDIYIYRNRRNNDKKKKDNNDIIIMIILNITMIIIIITMAVL
jgi:hypothetical protein